MNLLLHSDLLALTRTSVVIGKLSSIHSLMTVRLLKDSIMNLLRNARKDFVQDVPATLTDEENYHEREEKSSLFLLT